MNPFINGCFFTSCCMMPKGRNHSSCYSFLLVLAQVYYTSDSIYKCFHWERFTSVKNEGISKFVLSLTVQWRFPWSRLCDKHGRLCRLCVLCMSIECVFCFIGSVSNAWHLCNNHRQKVLKSNFGKRLFFLSCSFIKAVGFAPRNCTKGIYSLLSILTNQKD